MRFNTSIQVRSNYSIGFKNKKYIMGETQNDNSDQRMHIAV
jgi:hypothetical protein